MQWGVGCPSGPGTFTFAFNGAMIGGQTVGLDHTNAPPNQIGFNLFALSLNQPGLDLFPACTVYLPPAGGWINGNVFIFDNAGAASSPWPVPLGYPGPFFMSQSVALDTTSPLGLIVSNAGAAVIQ
jgi:hypothetical protein